MRRIAALLSLCSSIALVQAPQLSPQAAYDQAIAPMEITHRSIANWSDIETAALGVAVQQAGDACQARTSVTYTGDDLIAFARLCALGQQWQATFTAATTYINSKDVAKPQLAQAYAYEVDADLNLKDEKSALHASIAMLQAVPYGPLSDEVTTSTIRYLQLAFTDDAITLHLARQPTLLRLLSTPPAAPAQPNAAAPIPLHTLFEHALDFAALEQYVNQPRLASGIISDIDAATPSNLSPDDAIPIANARRQYALLGTRLPSISVTTSLLSPTAPPRINPDFGASTILLLFPPWCAQCIRQAPQIAPAISRLGGNVRIYGLLADNPPAAPPPAATPAKPQPASPAKAIHHPTSRESAEPPAPTPPDKTEAPKSEADQLRGTPTLVVAPSTVASFGANDFPFLIATDHDGIIRLLLPAAPENAFVVGGAIDQITRHIVAEWVPSHSATMNPNPKMNPKQ
jgi:hypothetical protein